MKYYEVNFTVSPAEQTARDLLAALAGDAGFETFEDTDSGMKGYVQQQLFDEDALRQVIDDFPLPDVAIDYTVVEAEDRDWNEQWEQQGFEPIVVGDRLIIHDGRHGGVGETGVVERMGHIVPISVEIDARQAFGTGTHETTRMVCATLLEIINLQPSTFNPETSTFDPQTSTFNPQPSTLGPLSVLDCGTGTGILSIVALKLGAAKAVGYDIDEWSVDNARHNAVINQVDDRFTPLLGDATILNNVEGVFDVVMANINRNILLNDMPQFRRKMATGARLILSGFYTADVPLLIDRAAELGLVPESQREENGWACIVLRAKG